MLVLGLETSTSQSSVTIGSEQGIIGSCLVGRGASHGEFLLPAVEFIMSQANLTYRNLSAVAVGLGPGLYTGMRVGITTGKTIAQALSVPIIGVSSLDLLAFEVRYSNKLICPVLDAKRSEVFFAFYRQVPGGITRESNYMVGTPEKLVGEVESRGGDVLLVGNGALLYKARLEDTHKVEFGSIANAFPRATSLVELALPRLFREDFDKLFDIEPFYMRRSDAEINWEKRSSNERSRPSA
ncbi:MAG: tRNA (adenosine(37)-N6)-threonylcarbamoyltransferase complex dimerization subunit type 1 TsaB [Actinomycetota bacterium]|nr:tRNA (adenosine(37)-N6)-threonylcarbamoyltransferase complex dimerization subunit type 1 TsaB [Actinomycetota bacterium]